MRVRIKESPFCLRALRATLASFRMAAARSTLGSCSDNLLGRRVMATADPLYNRDGGMRNLDLRGRCNLEYRFA